MQQLMLVAGLMLVSVLWRNSRKPVEFGICVGLAGLFVALASL